MTFLETIKISPSKGELKFIIECHRRGLHKHMYPLDSVIILVSAEVTAGTILTQNAFTVDLLEKLKEKAPADQPVFTVPDSIFKRQAHLPLPVYLDGPVHKRRGIQNRDAKINETLCKLGFEPQRFDFKPTRDGMSDQRCLQIVDAIEGLL